MEEKENNKIINKKVKENIIIAIIIMTFCIGINCVYNILSEENTKIIIKIISMIFMIISIIIFEFAYKKDSGKLAIYGIEILVLASYTLSITYISKLKNIQSEFYIYISTYTFAIYYILKCIIIYTKEKKKYLESFNDIKEIVENKPQKKEAKRKKLDN